MRKILTIPPQPQKSSEMPETLKSVFPELARLAKDSKQETTVLLSPTTGPNSKGTGKVTRRDMYSYQSTSKPESSSSHLSTMMPVCHASNETCSEATNNCSGHGTCYRKYTSINADPDSDAHVDCYACKCGSTVVRENADGTVKTVQWGGPACQKKDVSVPFFLLAGFTVLIVVVVAYAIGLLYSIGDEELPSVIGAGVTGARSQK